MKKSLILVCLLVISYLKFDAADCQNMVVNPNSIVVNASYLLSQGYNNQSTWVDIIGNIVSIDPNTFNGYTQLTYIYLWSNKLRKLK